MEDMSRVWVWVKFPSLSFPLALVSVSFPLTQVEAILQGLDGTHDRK